MENTKRPIPASIISWFFMIFTPIGFIATLFSFQKSPESFSRFSSFEISISLLTMALNFIFAVQLYRLKESAFWLLVASILVSTLPTIIHYFSGSIAEYYEGFEVGSFVGIIVWVGLFVYLWHLRKKNILS